MRAKPRELVLLDCARTSDLGVTRQLLDLRFECIEESHCHRRIVQADVDSGLFNVSEIFRMSRGPA